MEDWTCFEGLMCLFFWNNKRSVVSASLMLEHRKIRKINKKKCILDRDVFPLTENSSLGPKSEWDRTNDAFHYWKFLRFPSDSRAFFDFVQDRPGKKPRHHPKNKVRDFLVLAEDCGLWEEFTEKEEKINERLSHSRKRRRLIS